MLRVVFDTVVFVRSLINPYGRWGELVFRHHGRYQLMMSKPIIKEILEVLHRPEIVKKFRTDINLDLKTVIELLGRAPLVEVSKISAVSRDPKDNVFIATTEKAKADYLVSEDEDLLTLKSYKNIQIINALEFLRMGVNHRNYDYK